MKFEPKITAHDAMTPKVLSIDPSTTVDNAAKLMAKNDVSCLIIMNDSFPEGIITGSDIIRKLVSKDLKSSEIRVNQIMSKDLLCVEPDKELNEAVKIMAKNDIHRLPVVDNSILIGIITITDIMSVSPELTEILVEYARMEENEAETYSDDSNSLNAGICESCGNFEDILYDVDGEYICEDCKDAEK